MNAPLTDTAKHVTVPVGPLGFVRHWLVAGPKEVLYDGPPGAENDLRRTRLDAKRVEPLQHAELGGDGPFGTPWRYHYPGENVYLELTYFYHQQTVVDSYAFTEIEASSDCQREAEFWVAGSADLWLNDVHIARSNVPRYMNCDHRRVTLNLRKGVNRVCARLQCFGVRDTRILLGLQIIDSTGLRVHVPGADELVECANWLDGVHTRGRDVIVAETSAPQHTQVIAASGTRAEWPAGTSSFSMADEMPFQMTVTVAAQRQTLSRSLEIPGNRRPLSHLHERDQWLHYIAAGLPNLKRPLKGLEAHLPLLANRLLGRPVPQDDEALTAACAFVDSRGDCADFVLATLLRLVALKLTTKAETKQIERTALAFRYWSDGGIL